jgi:hypothetical protein
MANLRRRRSHLNGPIQDQAKDSSTASAPIDEEKIRQLASERYCERGRTDGHDMDDWLEAERLLRN